MSAHPASPRRGLLASVAAQLSAYVLEPVEPTVHAEPIELEPFPVVAVVSAARKSGASTIARLVAAELAARHDDAAVVWSAEPAGRRAALPSRAAARLATALRPGAGPMSAVGRLCLASGDAPARMVASGRYLAPVVLDLAPDGSAAASAEAADVAVVVTAAADQPALARAVALSLGNRTVMVVANRASAEGDWAETADTVAPESRIAARAAALGARAVGPLGAAIGELADALEAG